MVIHVAFVRGWGLWSKYYWSTGYPDANITRCWFQDCFIHKQAHSYKIKMSVHRPSADERLFPPTPVPRTDLCELALSLSSRPFTGDAAKEFTTTFREPWFGATAGGTGTATKINAKLRDNKGFSTTTFTSQRLRDFKTCVRKVIEFFFELQWLLDYVERTLQIH